MRPSVRRATGRPVVLTAPNPITLGGTDGTTLFMAATPWRGTDRMTDTSRTGQLLTAQAPAAGAGWP